MSWEELNKKPDKIQLDKNTKLLRQLAVSIFNNGKGLEFINLLKEVYSLSPICIPGSERGANEIREGEVNLLRKLIMLSKINENEE